MVAVVTLHVWMTRKQDGGYIISTSFFFSKLGAKIADVGNLLWAQMSYIVLVVVHLYLRWL